MDKKIQNLLNKWLENNLISESTYKNIVNFENNSNPSQKSKVAKTITLIGSLFLLSGLLGTLPLIWDNLAYWAQLLLLIVTTMFLIATGLIWGLYTSNEVLGPSWLGYLLSTSTMSIGFIVLIDDLLQNNDLLKIILLIFGSVVFVWASIQLSERVIFYIGGLGLIINLPRLITELLPDNIWPPLILFLVGGVLVALGLYLNSVRENLKK